MESSEIILHDHNIVSRFLFSKPVQPIPEERQHSVQDNSYFSRFLWGWVNGMLRKGFDRVVLPRDIPYVPEKDAMKHRFGDYKHYLTVHKPTPTTHYREIWALFYALRWRLLLAFTLKLVASGCQIGMSVLSRELIEEAEKITDLKGHGSHGPVSGYTIGLCALDVLLLVADLTSMYLGIMNSEYARTLMMACIHDKMLRLGPQQRYNFSAGKIMTLSSSDCRRASNAFIQMNAVLVLPAYLGATVGILIYMIGVSGLPGAGLLMLGLVISAAASFYVAVLRERSMPYQDQRISLERETIKNVSIIKFYGWEQSFLGIIKGLRAVETRFIRLIEFVDACNIAVVIGAPNLAGALSFAVKIIISSGLSPSRAFPSLTLFQMFQPILAEVSFALTTFADALVAGKRLNEFFRTPEVPSYVSQLPEDGAEHPQKLAARIVNGTFGWVTSDSTTFNTADEDLQEKKSTVDETFSEGSSTNSESVILDNVNLELPVGSMTLVIGSVGTGKTSLLSTFINTIPKFNGSVEIAHGAKVSSVLSLWSQNGAIRDNILFGLDWDPARYRKVIDICDLQSDFDLFSNGDLTDVGENGVTLSGGQRARLALARCLYSDGDLLILDDVLSAMDSRVANHIFRELRALTRSRGKAILFSTNNMKYTDQADFVVVLDGKGGARQTLAADADIPDYTNIFSQSDKKQQGHESIEEAQIAREHEMAQAKLAAMSLSHAGDEFATMSEAGLVNAAGMVAADYMEAKHQNQHVSEQYHGQGHGQGHGQSDGHGIEHAIEQEPSQTSQQQQEEQQQKHRADSDPEKNSGAVYVSQMDEETRAVGTVSISVLIRYFRLNSIWGFTLFSSMLLAVMCYSCSESMSNVVLNWWTSNRFNKSQGFNLGMYCLDVSLVAVFYALFSNLMSFVATASSTKLHNLALAGIYNSPMSFFQTNPLGRIMMRFTEDIVNLDTRLLAFARISYMTLFSMTASVIVVFVYVPWSLLCLLPIFVISFILMTFYRTTSRELNRCQQLYDSRGMSSVSEHIEGQEVITAFGMVEKSQDRLNDRLDDVISATLYNEATNFWMASRSGLLCEIINLVTIFLAVFQIFNLNSSEVGMLISILPTVRSNLILLFPMYALFDNQLNSVERLDEYATSLPVEGGLVADKTRGELESWSPTAGEIEFRNVDLRYRDDLPLVLNGLDVKFQGGKKIGICGRTGAGKSTIISALFRLVEVSSGSIAIDGQDISELPLPTLRGSLAILPQQPVLFQGTIRSNLDPFNQLDDKKLVDALQLSGISAGDPKFALNAEVQAEGTNFSLGERQMLALARATVRDAKILVLDEATAAVDQGTDERIQRTIKQVFRDCTVLCIAHRLETILDYDEILVMGPGGRLLEIGAPQALWNKQGGVFRSMCDEAGVGF